VWEEISGLPLHPLAVHAPLVLVPLLIVVGVGYAVIPAVRPRLAWALVALAVLAPVAVLAARLSGEAFRSRLAARDQLPAELAVRVDEHAGFSLTLLWLVIALGLVCIGMAVLAAGMRPGTRSDAEPAGRRPGAVVVWGLAAVAVLALSAGAGWYLVQTGDSGARMVWEGS
jgi:uncharacterized membrane protein